MISVFEIKLWTQRRYRSLYAKNSLNTDPHTPTQIEVGPAHEYAFLCKIPGQTGYPSRKVFGGRASRKLLTISSRDLPEAGFLFYLY